MRVVKLTKKQIKETSIFDLGEHIVEYFKRNPMDFKYHKRIIDSINERLAKGEPLRGWDYKYD